jgi:hypothetical protein
MKFPLIFGDKEAYNKTNPRTKNTSAVGGRFKEK